MAFEDIGAVEALLGSRARTRAKIANHGALVVRQGVTVLVIFTSKAFLMVLARHNWALFGPLWLMGQHMSLEILEYPTAIRVGTSTPFSAVILEPDACGP